MVKTRTNHLNQETHTLIADWLIDSGCTVHMTPYSHDFTSNLEPHHTLVETANGGLVEVEEKGTVKLLINDAFNHNNETTIYLNDVLYVPQLNRRLFSVVAEWNRCGGTVTFLMDRCRISIFENEDKLINTIDVDPIYAIEEVNQQQVLSVNNNKRVSVSQTLLHQRLGHRATSALHLAHEDNLWSGIIVRGDKDHFCETCRITTARKANRGKNPIETLEDLVPGTFISVDIVKNPTKESITPATYFQYYLAITDVASRFLYLSAYATRQCQTCSMPSKNGQLHTALTSSST
jgi:hypothetical protein